MRLLHAYRFARIFLSDTTSSYAIMKHVCDCCLGARRQVLTARRRRPAAAAANREGNSTVVPDGVSRDVASMATVLRQTVFVDRCPLDVPWRLRAPAAAQICAQSRESTEHCRGAPPGDELRSTPDAGDLTTDFKTAGLM
jgi:hypothetical protein